MRRFLASALVLLAGPTLAGPPEADATVLQAARACAAIDLPALRLACLDRVLGTPATRTALQTPGGPWVTEASKDKMDDTPVFRAMKPSEEAASPMGWPAVLVFECRGDLAYIGVQYPGVVGRGRTRLDVRIDSQAARPEEWQVSSADPRIAGGSFDAGERWRYRELAAARTVALRLNPESGGVAVVSFDVGGFREFVPRIETSCPLFAGGDRPG